MNTDERLDEISKRFDKWREEYHKDKYQNLGIILEALAVTMLGIYFAKPTAFNVGAVIAFLILGLVLIVYSRGGFKQGKRQVKDEFDNNNDEHQTLTALKEAERESLSEIEICQATWSMENTLLQAYRAVCAAIEAFLIGTGMGLLSSLGKTGPFWIVFAGGIAVAFFWMVVCIRRADIANMWSREVITRAKGRIRIEDKKTKQILKVKGIFIDSPYEYEDTKPSLWLSGFLNWGIPLILIILWISVTLLIHPK